MQKVCFVGDFFKNVAMSTNLSGESPLTENGSVLNSSANAGQIPVGYDFILLGYLKPLIFD